LGARSLKSRSARSITTHTSKQWAVFCGALDATTGGMDPKALELQAGQLLHNRQSVQSAIDAIRQLAIVNRKSVESSIFNLQSSITRPRHL
jgi:hypothetical protein